MNPKGKIINGDPFIFSTPEKAADPINNMADGLHTLPAGTDIFILEAPNVNGRTVYKVSAGKFQGYVLKQYVDIDGPKISSNTGAELFDRSAGRKLEDASVNIPLGSPIWVTSSPEKLAPPGGQPEDFVHVQFWMDEGYQSEGYVRVSDLNRLTP